MLTHIIQNWFVLLWILGMINFFFIFPIIFNFFLIPHIEKKVGEKLTYKQLIYRLQIFARWFGPHAEVGEVIVIQYLTWKFLKRLPGKIWGYNPRSTFALPRVHYDIRQASGFEIIMSFLTTINQLFFIAIIIINLPATLLSIFQNF